MKTRLREREPSSHLARIADANVDADKLFEDSGGAIQYDPEKNQWLLSSEAEYFIYIARYINTGHLTGFRDDQSLEVLMAEAQMFKLEKLYQICCSKLNECKVEPKQIISIISPSPEISLYGDGSSTSESNQQLQQSHSLKRSGSEANMVPAKRPRIQWPQPFLPPMAVLFDEYKQWGPEGFIAAAKHFYNLSPPDLISTSASLWMSAVYVVKKLFLSLDCSIVSHSCLRKFCHWAILICTAIPTSAKENVEKMFYHAELMHRFSYSSEHMSKDFYDTCMHDVDQFVTFFSTIKPNELQPFLNKFFANAWGFNVKKINKTQVK